MKLKCDHFMTLTGKNIFHDASSFSTLLILLHFINFGYNLGNVIRAYVFFAENYHKIYVKFILQSLYKFRMKIREHFV